MVSMGTPWGPRSLGLPLGPPSPSLGGPQAPPLPPPPLLPAKQGFPFVNTEAKNLNTEAKNPNTETKNPNTS